MAQEETSRLRLIPGSARPITGMSNAPRPLFPVPVASSKTPAENVQALSTVAHVCEVKGAYALVHASPLGVAKIASELGLECFHSKKGGEYYAVRVARGANLGLVPQAQAAPQAVPPVQARPVQAPSLEPGVVRLEIRDQTYIVRQTTPKRRMDVLRFEVRKDNGDIITEPYVVSFQAADGSEGQCSCKDWIYRRHVCKHINGVRNALVRPRQATLPLAIAN